MKRSKFKFCEAIVFEPAWWDANPQYHSTHPLKKGEVVYYLGEIPNVEGHCIVATYEGKVVPMIHPDDCRKARDEEL